MKRKNNKGEWSEFYAFLKILEERKISAADKNLRTIDGKFFIFIKIIREEDGNGAKVYDLSESNTKVLITDKNGNLLREFDSRMLKEKTLKIFERIKKEKKRSFEIPEVEDVMMELLCNKIKVNNSQKTDLMAIVYDRISDTMPTLGFSIKSMVGGASTLLNAGKTTNFIYEVKEFRGSVSEINEIKTNAQIRDRIRKISESGGKLEYFGVSNERFKSNLKKIDTAFPEFIAQMLLNYFSSADRTVSALTTALSENDKMLEKYGLSLEDYRYKMKNFLDAVALGMMPSILWNGISEAQGGYIVVKENGEVICYHLYNRDEFRSYLYENTKFETPSTTKFDYGKLYEVEGRLFLKLCLQIRFLR